MTHSRHRTPRRLRPIPTPPTWTAAQAFAVADFCDHLAAAIWDAYSEEILAYLDDIATRTLTDDRLRQILLPLDDDPTSPALDSDLPF
jgi:hypothetical protein